MSQDEAAECLGKGRLPPARAKKLAKKMGAAQAYRCRHCGCWHVGGPVHVALRKERLHEKLEKQRRKRSRHRSGNW